MSEGGGVGGGELKIRATATDEASAKLKEIGENAQSLGSKISSALSGMANVAGGILLANIGEQITSGLSGAISSVTDLGMATRKLEMQTGMTAEQTSGLLAVFDKMGVSTQQASTSLGIFSKGITTYLDGTAKAQEKSTGFAGAVNSLGLTLKDASGTALPLNSVLNDVANKFQAMPDGVQKTADAMALFGRSGKDMIPVLDLGAAGMQQLTEDAAKYGLVLTQNDVAAVFAFTQAHKDLDEAMTGVWTQVGVIVLPLLVTLAHAVASAAQTFNTTILPVLRSVADYISTNFGPPIEAVLALIGQGFNALAGIVSGALGDVLSIVDSVGQAIYEALSWLDPFASHSPPLVDQVQNGVSAIIGSYSNLANVQPILDATGSAIESFAGNSKASIDEMVKANTQALDELKNALSDAQTQLNNWGKTPIQGTKAFEDQLASLKTQTDQTQVAINNIKLGQLDPGGTTANVQKLQEQLKLLNAQAPGKDKGAVAQHAAAVKDLQNQIAQLQTTPAANQLQALQDHLQALQLQTSNVNLNESLQLDPLKKQIQDAISPPLAEQPFATILQGAQDAKAKIEALTPAIATQTQVGKELSQAASDVAAATTKAGKAAGGAAGPMAALADVGTNVGNAFGNAKATIQDWTAKVDAAKATITTFFQPLATAVGNISAAFQAGGIGAGIEALLTTIGSGLSGLGTVIGKAFAAINWSQVFARVGSVASSITSWLAGEWAKINWTQVWAAVTTFADGALAWLATIPSTLLTIAGKIRDALVTAVQSIDWASVGQSIAQKASEATASTDWRAALTSAGAVQKSIDAYLQGVLAVNYQPIGYAIGSGVADAVVAFFVSTSEGGPAIITWLQHLNTEIGEAILKVGGDLAAGLIQGFVTKILTYASDAISGALQSALANVNVQVGALTINSTGFHLESSVLADSATQQAQMAGILGFGNHATGGYVNAPFGVGIPAIIHGGESITPAGQASGGGSTFNGGIHITINGNGDPATVQQAAYGGVLEAARALGLR